jgi:hypothetical protein
MAGLQTLMQRGQMPGQAGSFSALPGQQGRNPVAFTASLKQLPPEELIRLYNDTNDFRPKWAVASAYADAMKAKALQQGVEGQQAMAQNAAAQQQPPVADEVMTQMAASGGEMKSYTLGGGIAEGIDNLDEDVVAQLSPEGGSGFSEEDRQAQEEQKRRQKIREQFEFVQKAESEPAVQRMLKEHPWLAQQQETAPSTNAGASAASSASSGTGFSVKQVSREEPEQKRQGLAALSDPGLTQYASRLEDDYRKLMDIRGKQGEVSPEIKAARGRLEEMRAGQLQKIQEDSGKIREEGIRQLQGRLDSARRPLIEDPEALLALAASINTEKGKVLGSLSAGGAKVLGERRSRAEKAEEGISALSDKIRLLNSQYMEAQALEEQRKLAILTNDAEGKRNAELAQAQLAVEMRKTQADIDYRMRSADAEREKARAAGDSTAAAREATNVQRLTIALGNREKSYRDAKEEWLKGMPVKMAAMKASASGAKPEDVDKWKQMQQDFEKAFRDSDEIKNQDAAIARLGQLAGVPLPGAWRMREVPAQTGGN